MKLVDYKDPILKEKSKVFDFNDPPFDSIEYSQKLIRFVYDNNIICVAGIQVGIPYRVFAMRGAPENYVMYNPRIVMPSAETIVLEETSATYPDFICKVSRPQHVKVRFATPNGEIRTETFTGLSARVFQHNMDFLEGERFWKTCSKLQFDMAKKKSSLEFLTFR